MALTPTLDPYRPVTWSWPYNRPTRQGFFWKLALTPTPDPSRSATINVVDWRMVVAEEGCPTSCKREGELSGRGQCPGDMSGICPGETPDPVRGTAVMDTAGCPLILLHRPVETASKVLFSVVCVSFCIYLQYYDEKRLHLSWWTLRINRQWFWDKAIKYRVKIGQNSDHTAPQNYCIEPFSARQFCHLANEC